LSQQQNEATFVPPPPPSFESGGSFYSPYVLESKRKEAESEARTALILSLIGFFVCVFLGLIALPKANNALEIMKIYEVGRDSHGIAVAAKVLAIIEIFGFAVLLLSQIVVVMLNN
jgi:hypothetical protein